MCEKTIKRLFAEAGDRELAAGDGPIFSWVSRVGFPRRSRWPRPASNFSGLLAVGDAEVVAPVYLVYGLRAPLNVVVESCHRRNVLGAMHKRPGH
jgi:hypothetical protein